MEPEWPQRVGRYELLEILGQGSMGVVYKARDSVLDRIVAVKTYRRDLVVSEEVRSRFEREVRTASKLAHPNIVTVYDGGLDGEIPFLAMEYVEGKTLDAIMHERGRMPIGEVLEIVDQIAAGLAFAHEKGVVHRDVKPANILMPRAGLLKIADFGVAKVIGASTVTHGAIGTPRFMAPEQFRDESADARADVFSLGCIAYELLTGRQAFPGTVLTAVLHGIMNEEPPRPSEVVSEMPPAVDRVIARALAKDRNQRTRSAAEFATELRVATPPTLGEDERARRRHALLEAAGSAGSSFCSPSGSVP